MSWKDEFDEKTLRVGKNFLKSVILKANRISFFPIWQTDTVSGMRITKKPAIF